MAALFIFAVVLAAAGGFIAWLGDWLGTRIGKKRLSFRGLRPRHTAMLFTVVSGILIALLTLIILFLFNQEIQRAILQGPRLVRENRQLSHQNYDLLHRNHAAELQGQVSEANAAMAKTAAVAAMRQAAHAEDALRGSLHDLRVASDNLRRSHAELRQRQAELHRAQQQVLIAQSSLGGTRRQLHLAQSRLHQAKHAVLVADANVQRAGTEYVRAQSNILSLAKQGDLLIAHNAALTHQNAGLEDDNRRLTNQNTFLEGTRLIYHKGQEVGRRVIPTDLSPEAIQTRLREFLDDMGRETERAGGHKGDNGRAVLVLTPLPPSGAADVVYSEEQNLEALTQSIAAQAGEATGVVVVARVRFNTFLGEQAKIDITPYNNVLVFPKGSLIASQAIDGTQPENVILAALQDFLTKQVRETARNQGIIPRPDPQTGEPTVGEPIASATWVALVKQIQSIGANAQVTAQAGEDTYSSGPLRLNLAATPPAAPQPAAPAPQTSVMKGRGAGSQVPMRRAGHS